LSRSADIWKKGKAIKSFPSEVNKENYLRHMKEGKGFPSIWLPSNNDDLERIALGIMLCKGHFDKIELIGFKECCFEKTKINIKQSTNLEFPLPSVGYLHYELHIDDGIDLDSNLIESIEVFLHCNGNFKKFQKTIDSETEKSMLSIVKKYIGEISDEKYIKKANEWIEKYEN
jgi:hypothetical protein